MQRVTREVVYRETGRLNPPALTVEPGETVLVETELCTGDWLHTAADRWSPEVSRGPNPAPSTCGAHSPATPWPRIEDATHLMTVACARPAEDAFRIAVGELVYWLCDDYGFEESDAVLWLAQLLEARCTQFVDPEYTYIAKVRREYLPHIT